MFPANPDDDGLLLSFYIEDLDKNYNISSTQANLLCQKYIRFNTHCQDQDKLNK